MGPQETKLSEVQEGSDSESWILGSDNNKISMTTKSDNTFDIKSLTPKGFIFAGYIECNSKQYEIGSVVQDK